MQKDYQQGNDDDIENLYSDKGHPRIIVFIQYLFGILSMRQTMKGMEVNAAYRCSLTEHVLHFETLGSH